jgi:hypothetical protein
MNWGNALKNAKGNCAGRQLQKNWSSHLPGSRFPAAAVLCPLQLSASQLDDTLPLNIRNDGIHLHVMAKGGWLHQPQRSGSIASIEAPLRCFPPPVNRAGQAPDLP